MHLMNHWKIKYNVLKVKFTTEWKYVTYRLKSRFGIKTIGYEKSHGLILIKLLDRYKPRVYSVHVTSTKSNLDLIDLQSIHDYGIRLNKADYLSIILNQNDLQVKVVTGEKLRTYIEESTETEIEKAMQEKIEAGEILAGLELGIKRISHCLKKRNG